MAENWLKIGATVKVDGVNDDYVGEIVDILPGRVVLLKNAYWVSDSGRLSAFLKNGEAERAELERVGDVAVHWETIAHWPHSLELGDHVP